jgi:hypothetical protein
MSCDTRLVAEFLAKMRPNPSLNADVPSAGAARSAAGRQLASIR